MENIFVFVDNQRTVRCITYVHDRFKVNVASANIEFCVSRRSLTATIITEGGGTRKLKSAAFAWNANTNLLRVASSNYGVRRRTTSRANDWWYERDRGFAFDYEQFAQFPQNVSTEETSSCSHEYPDTCARNSLKSFAFFSLIPPPLPVNLFLLFRNAQFRPNQRETHEWFTSRISTRIFATRSECKSRGCDKRPAALSPCMSFPAFFLILRTSLSMPVTFVGRENCPSVFRQLYFAPTLFPLNFKEFYVRIEVNEKKIRSYAYAYARDVRHTPKIIYNTSKKIYNKDTYITPRARNSNRRRLQLKILNCDVSRSKIKIRSEIE